MQYRYKSKSLALCLLLLLGACSDSEMNLNIPVSPRELPLLEIQSPVNGAVLPANQSFILSYEVVQGDNGDHVVIQVDKQKPVTVHQTYGRHHIEGLPPGKHTIIVSEYTSTKQATGAQAVIHLTMQ